MNPSVWRGDRVAPSVRHCLPLGLVLLATACYAVIIWRAFPAAHTDVGDDYAYVAWQVSRGAHLYRDVLGHQTPLLYLLGGAVYRLWPAPDALAVVGLCAHCATVLGLYALARGCRLSAPFAGAACLIYLLLPMGFLFGRRFDPSVLTTLGGVLCALGCLRLSRGRAALVGVGAAVFLLAKLTFFPIGLALGAYLAVTRCQYLRPYLLAALTTLLAVTVVGYVDSGWAFIDGAYLGHVGSTLSPASFAQAVHYLWNVEGFSILAALAGGLLALRQGGAAALPAFYLAGGAATAVAAFSVGSFSTEMLAGEPSVALCAALTLREGLYAWRRVSPSLRRWWQPSFLLASLLVMGQALAVRSDALTLAMVTPFETLDCQVRTLLRYSGPQDPVIAPAYVAFLAQRTLVDGIDDTFNWMIHVRRGDQVARRQAADVTRRLAGKQMPVVVTTRWLELPPQAWQALVTSYVSAPLCTEARLFLPAR